MGETEPGKKKEEQKDLFTPTGELAGGYDLGMARAYALDHAKKTIGESVGWWWKRRSLLWEIEQAGWDEDAECWEVVLSAQPARAQVQQKGVWVYHVRPVGGLLPGTPLLRQEFRYTLPREGGSRWLLALAALVILGVVGGGGLLLARGWPGGAQPASPPAVAPLPPTATPTPFPTPAPFLTPVPTPTPLPTPLPTPTPIPTATLTPTPTQILTSTPIPAPTATPTPRPTPTATSIPTATPTPVPT